MADKVVQIPGNANQYIISDPEFIRRLANLRDLCDFIRREKLDADKAKLLVLDEVGRLRKKSLFRREEGRGATEQEWMFVETRTQELHGLLDDAHRRAFYLHKTEWALIWIPLVTITLAAGSLIAAFSYPPGVSYCYIIWLMVLGALGSNAYVSMNALALQNDITFDLGNKKLLTIRLLLGAIFGLVLALPFGLNQFREFAQHLASSNSNTSTDDTAKLTQAALLLMPFVFGFSTTVVLTIINRLVDAIGVVFGRTPPVRTGERIPPTTS
jgi:hypothetical protein